jgi:hypothetical protein
MQNTPTIPAVVDTKYGRLYIAVAPADRDNYHDIERGNVTDLLPRLYVATDPAFEANPNADDHWTIRGRAHAVHYQIHYRKHAANGKLWHRALTPNAGGFRKTNGGQVEFRSATYGQMWEALTTALDTFADTHAGWQALSHYLLLSGDGNTAQQAAEQARTEAAKQDKIAGDFFRQAGAVGAKLAPALLDMLPATEEI